MCNPDFVRSKYNKANMDGNGDVEMDEVDDEKSANGGKEECSSDVESVCKSTWVCKTPKIFQC